MRWAILCVALCACSRIFGLDDIGNDDRDGDHVPDAIDNCPNDYNPDQSDFDGNGIGDRCDFCGAASGGSNDDDDGDGIPNECDACDNRLPDDNHDGVPDACEQLNDAGMQVINPLDAGSCPNCLPCSKGPAHDEDGDLIADACDLCPIDMATMDLDSDGDGVGDTCDPSTAPSHQLFDPFATPNQDWYQIGAGTWSVTSDHLHISAGAMTQYRVLGTGIGHFALRTKVSGAAGANNDTTMSLVAARPSFEASIDTVRCAIVLPMGPAAIPQLQIEHQEQGFPDYTNSLDLSTSGSGKYTFGLDYVDGKLTCVAFVGPSMTPNTLMAPVQGVTMGESFATGVASRGGNSNFDYYSLVTDDN